MAIFVSKSQQPFSSDTDTPTPKLNQPEGGINNKDMQEPSSPVISSHLVLKPSTTSEASLDRERVLRRIRHHKALNRVRNALYGLVMSSSHEANKVSACQCKWMDPDDAFSSP